MFITRDGDYQFFNVGTKAFNCYCITYKDKAVLVDPGPLSERDAIEQNLQKDFLFAIDAIVLTHAHGDTAGNAEYFSMLFNCPVYCSRDSLEAVRHGIFPKPPKDHPYIKKAGSVGKIVFKLPSFMPFEGCRSAEVITSTVIHELLGDAVVLLMTPGHSADSISLRIGPVAIIGDCAQYMKRVLAPVFVDDEEQLGKTWATLIGLSCKYYLTSHGRAFDTDEWVSQKEEKN